VLAALLEAVLDAGMREATEVLFSGGSAGGIGALHAARATRALVPNVRRFKVLIVSGFFLERGLPKRARGGGGGGGAHAASGFSPTPSNFEDEEPTCRHGRGAADKCIPWVQKMRRMCALHNCSGAVVAGGCGADLPAHQRWRCLFGRHAAAHAGAPTFVVNSALDSWQMVNVWRRYARCRWDGDSHCDQMKVEADVAETNQMLKAFVRDLRLSGVLDRPGNGAFIYSCNEHVAGLASSAFMRYEVNGRTMRDAIADWWSSDDDAPPRQHTYMPCELRQNSSTTGGGLMKLAHHACNPSCDAYRMKRRLTQECPCSP
jgi:hypothetical protein